MTPLPPTTAALLVRLHSWLLITTSESECCAPRPTFAPSIAHTAASKNILIEPLHIKRSDLSTKQMLDLMAVSNNDGPMPLYLHTVYRVLREIRMEQQETGGTFDYLQFKAKLLDSGLASQLGPLGQRLETLESFMPILQTAILVANDEKKRNTSKGTDWSSKVSCLKCAGLCHIK